MAESKEELKSLLMRVEDENEKVSLKLNIKEKLIKINKLILKKLRSWHLVPSLHGKYMGKRWKQGQISSSWALKSLWMMTTAVKLEDDCFLAGKL